MNKYAHVLNFVVEHPWALTPAMREKVAAILARRVAGEDPDQVELAALVPRRNGAASAGKVAVIPVYGVIAPRMNLLSDISGGTTFEGLTAQLHEALKNPEVGTIVFDVDSPGGNVAGASEFADEVRKARAQKTVIAQAQHLMASAAYWVMAGATKIVASPSAMVGSIGVYTMHDDISGALEQLGVTRTVIGAGKFKTELVDGPLSADAQAYIATVVDFHYDKFINDVAKGRGVKPAAVRSGYGEGRAVTADQALTLGMVDRIGTLAETLASAGATTTTTLTPVAVATDQEPPSAATSQERQADVLWQNAAVADLLKLDFVEGHDHEHHPTPD